MSNEKDYFGEIDTTPDEYIGYRGTKDISGQRFNKWLVVRRLNYTQYLCKCDCGYEAVRRIIDIAKQESKQCKHCRKIEMTKKESSPDSSSDNKVVKDYFGDEQHEQVSNSVDFAKDRNFEGKTFNGWTAIKKISSIVYICRCKCGYEAKRKIYSIMTSQSTRCIRCYRKSNEISVFRGVK